MTVNHKIMIEVIMVSLDVIKMRMKEAINQSGLSQTELAKRLSVTQSCIAHYIKGDSIPSLETFAVLCEVLDEDPAYILGLDNASRKMEE